MEPFGLLHFLQSLLQNPPTGDQNAQNEGDSSPTQTEKMNERTDEKKSAFPKETEMVSSSQDACLKFMQAHDTRSNRTRKK